MLDLSVYKKKYFEVKINDSNVINLEFPTKKQLKTMLTLTKNINNGEITDKSLDDLYSAAHTAFNKNKERKSFSMEFIEENLNIKALYAFFEEYYTWVNDNMNQKN